MAWTRSASGIPFGNEIVVALVQFTGEQLLEPMPRLLNGGDCAGLRLGDRLDAGDAVTLDVVPRETFVFYLELLRPSQDDVVSSVSQPLRVCDEPGAADRIHRRFPLVVRRHPGRSITMPISRSPSNICTIGDSGARRCAAGAAFREQHDVEGEERISKAALFRYAKS